MYRLTGEDSEVSEKSNLNIENIDDAELDPDNVINVLNSLRKKKLK